MKSLIRWAIQNTPAMNTAMVAVMLVGGLSLYWMHRELFPEFELDFIHITVPYPGANPEEVEQSICQRIEEAVQSLDGIKEINGVANEGAGSVILELESNVPDVQKVLNEVRSEVDRIPSFPPERAEEPEVKQITLRSPAIKVAVMGPSVDSPEGELNLRTVAEQIRDELLQLDTVSQVSISAAKDYQIDVELSEDTLRKYGLTLQRVADIIRRENIEVPGGTIRTSSQEVLVRAKNEELVGEEIAKIPLVTRKDGVVLTVGDLGNVRDEFVDVASSTFVNGRPAMVVSVNKTADEDLLAIVGEVEHMIETLQHGEAWGGFRLPEGYQLATFSDSSIVVRDRLELLTKNGLQGLILVFIVLSIFLELRLAFWVALGIPISILGGCAILFAGGQTLNMLSMFAFLMALGILVDDAIVVGENVYTHRGMGKGFLRAAVDGTYEVLPSVVASVMTTVIAFMPLLFVPGIMGKFIAVMPLAVIAMLLISLVECTFILPCHLAHSGEHDAEKAARAERRAEAHRRRFWLWTALGAVWFVVFLVPAIFVAIARRDMGPLAEAMEGTAWLADWAVPLAIALFVVAMIPYLWYPLRRSPGLFAWANRRANGGLQWLIAKTYLPSLRWALHNPWTVFATAAAVMLICLGLYKGGIVAWTAFPKLDAYMVQAVIVYPDGTPEAVTEQATRRAEEAILRVGEKYSRDGEPIIKTVMRIVGSSNPTGEVSQQSRPEGSHAGGLLVELVDAESRPQVTSMQIIEDWREEAGSFPGAEKVEFREAQMGPGGKSIEFKFLAQPRDMAAMEAAVEAAKKKLTTYPGVSDISDDSQPGKWEFQTRVKDDAEALGVNNAELANTIRASYYGEEVMRLQRGRHEVKLMVRYPRDQRRSLAQFDEIRIRTDDGLERPITELAKVDVERGYSTINRLNQRRAITVTADVNEDIGNASNIVNDLKQNFVPKLLDQHPGVRVRWEGQAEQTAESIGGLIVGLAVALACMFALLTLEFRSYVQPLLIMAIIPFGAIGAVLGHLVMGLDLTLFSVFGLVALTGVVVNDSIVLIDFINHRVRDGLPVKVALLDAGRRRFRPVLLTSLTTVAGLLPLLLERSMQAQVIIPMATSLSFGLIFATALVLVLVPTFYLVYAKVTGAGNHREVHLGEEDLAGALHETISQHREEQAAAAERETPGYAAIAESGGDAGQWSADVPGDGSDHTGPDGNGDGQPDSHRQRAAQEEPASDVM